VLYVEVVAEVRARPPRFSVRRGVEVVVEALLARCSASK
jgi:hypothetical protein